MMMMLMTVMMMMMMMMTTTTTTTTMTTTMMMMMMMTTTMMMIMMTMTTTMMMIKTKIKTTMTMMIGTAFNSYTICYLLKITILLKYTDSVSVTFATAFAAAANDDEAFIFHFPKSYYFTIYFLESL